MRTLVLFASVFVFASCTAGPTHVEGIQTYDYDLEFLTAQAEAELRDSWRIAGIDSELRTITTEWVLRLSPFRTVGSRNRLIVAFEGDREAGFTVKCTQESEQNDDIERPTDPEAASWSESKNDGALAGKFIRNFDRRVSPNDSWRREARR